jgi:hypothetical protein
MSSRRVGEFYESGWLTARLPTAKNSSDVHPKEASHDHYDDNNADEIEDAHFFAPTETHRTSRHPYLGDI